jgi:hypothetical protein
MEWKNGVCHSGLKCSVLLFILSSDNIAGRDCGVTTVEGVGGREGKKPGCEGSIVIDEEGRGPLMKPSC